MRIPYSLQSENIRGYEFGHKTKIFKVESADSDKLSPRSATMFDQQSQQATKLEPQTQAKHGSLRAVSPCDQVIDISAHDEHSYFNQSPSHDIHIISTSQNSVPTGQNVVKISNFDLLSNPQNEQLVSSEIVGSETLHDSSFHSIANRNTFHADSSDSHLVKQFAHAGHVDHENHFLSQKRARERERKMRA